MTSCFGKTTARLVAENADSYGWANLTLAVQLLLPLALLALILARKRIWIYPYPVLDTYISVLCPSFSQQQRLLKWMSSRIPHMNNLPNKITQYWQNGSLLCTLINTVVPGACPNPQKHWKKPPTHGQALAYKYLGVAPILTENDFNKQALTSYWERKFIKYLLSIQEAINKVTVEEDTLKFTSKYVARGMGLVIGEQNRPSFFYIYPNTGSNKIENILVNVKGPYNTFGGQMISSAEISQNVKSLDVLRKDSIREEKKLAYRSKAQRSFFRSVSFDIGPIINLVSNRKNTGEISVRVEMEEDRAKVIFVPTFSGIYEVLLTNDGQHLQGSPFIIRIMKNNKEVENVLQEKEKLTKGKIERKIIGKSIDFISESVTVTDDLCLKLDSNNNTDCKELKEPSETNRSDDEISNYQDSGVFDLSDQSSNRSRQRDLEEIDEDSRFSETSDANTTDESKNNSLDYKSANDKLETSERNIDKIIELEGADAEQIVIHTEMPDDVKFLTEQYEKESHFVPLEVAEAVTPLEQGNSLGVEEEVNQDEMESTGVDSNSDDDIFDNDDLQNNRDFENLYNKYAEGDNVNPAVVNSGNINTDEIQLIESNDTVTKTETKEIPNISKISETSTQNINCTSFEVLKNIPQFQKGRRITSSVEKILEIFEENDCSKKYQKAGLHLCIAEKKITQKSDFTYASPVLNNIAQEALVASDKLPKEDSVHLKGDGELSSRGKRPVLTKEYSVCIEDDEIFDTNVKEIKNIFEERKPQVTTPSIRKFSNTWRRHDGLQESKKILAKSLPNLHDNIKDSLEDLHTEDEFVAKFKEKRNFWNNLIIKNSSSNLNVSSPDVSPNSVKLMSKQYEDVSQSTNSLNTVPRTKKAAAENKFTRRKEELLKTASLDLTNSCEDDDSVCEKSNKIARAKSLYDRIRIFDKDFDSGKYNTLLKKTKERSDLKEKTIHPAILKPESLTEVPNTTSNNQIEEDLRFAEIMKERFEISRRYFCSLESLTVKPNLNRRHSMDSTTTNPREIPLQKGGSLKVLNVLDKFSLDNVYRDVVLSKLKNCSFKGRPNKEAVVETLSSVSSSEMDDFDKGKGCVEEEDLNMQFFNIKKRLRKRRSIKSIFDVNY